MSEKTLKATPKKQQDARKEGLVAKSQDVLKFAGVLCVYFVLEQGSEAAFALFQRMTDASESLSARPFGDSLELMAMDGLKLFGLMAGGALVFASLFKIAVTWLQSGFVFAPTKIKPDPGKLSPVKQIQNLFSKDKFWELFTSILKTVLLFFLGVVLLKSVLNDLLGLSGVRALHVLPGVSDILGNVLYPVMLLLFAISGLDLLIQKRFHDDRLKMTHQEQKQERKNAEGDPHIKSKRKTLASELLQSPQPSLADVKNADVVVVNPTHIAIALNYDAAGSQLPRILYKATDKHAKVTIQYAQSHQVPVVRYYWLARTLHKCTVCGDFIPREAIQATATVYRFLKSMRTQWDADHQSVPEIQEDGSICWPGDEQPAQTGETPDAKANEH